MNTASVALPIEKNEKYTLQQLNERLGKKFDQKAFDLLREEGEEAVKGGRILLYLFLSSVKGFGAEVNL